MNSCQSLLSSFVCFKSCNPILHLISLKFNYLNTVDNNSNNWLYYYYCIHPFIYHMIDKLIQLANLFVKAIIIIIFNDTDISLFFQLIIITMILYNWTIDAHTNTYIYIKNSDRNRGTNYLTMYMTFISCDHKK